MTGAAPGTAGGGLGGLVVVVVEETDGGEVVEVDGRTEGVVPPCPDVVPACGWSWGTVGAATVAGLGAGELLLEREAARATAAPMTKTAAAITAPASHRSPRRSPHRDPPSLDGRGVSTATEACTGPGKTVGSWGRGSGAAGSVVGRTTAGGGSGGSPADSRTRRTALSIAPRARRPGVPWGGSGVGPSVMTSLRDMFPHCRASMRAPGPASGILLRWRVGSTKPPRRRSPRTAGSHDP